MNASGHLMNRRGDVEPKRAPGRAERSIADRICERGDRSHPRLGPAAREVQTVRRVPDHRRSQRKRGVRHRRRQPRAR